MPRYGRYGRHDSYWERRAEEKYYDYIYENCLCPYYEDEDGNFQTDDSDPCTHCRWEKKKAEERIAEEAERQRLEEERIAREAAHPHAREIATIRKWLDVNAEALREGNLGKQLDSVRALFTEILGFDTFMAKYPKFRAAVVAKLEGMRAEPRAEPLKELFEHVDAFLARLPAVEGYVA